MSNGTDRERPDFSHLKPYIEAAVELAEKFGEPYRAPIVDFLLQVGISDGHAPGEAEPTLPGAQSSDLEAEAPGGIKAVADDIDVDAEDLHRTLAIDEEGQITVLPTIEGSSTAERCRRTAIIYAYVKEKALGDLDVGIDELREEVQRQGAYDSPNFARNLTQGELLYDIGKKGSSKKRYRLSTKGKEKARSLLRSLAEGEE